MHVFLLSENKNREPKKQDGPFAWESSFRLPKLLKSLLPFRYLQHNHANLGISTIGIWERHFWSRSWPTKKEKWKLPVPHDMGSEKTAFEQFDCVQIIVS